MRRALNVALGLLALLALTGCRDTPDEVLVAASEAAARGDLVEMRELFSISTTHRVQHAWQADGLPEGRGWETLASRLHLSKKPLEVDPAAKGAVEIHGDYAKVVAQAGVDKRDYYLRKEDGVWRIELGAGARFRKAKAEAEAAKGAKGGEEKGE